jgi:hypothetical protein
VHSNRAIDLYLRADQDPIHPARYSSQPSNNRPYKNDVREDEFDDDDDRDRADIYCHNEQE